MPNTAEPVANASLRHMHARAATVGLLMRHCANTIVAVFVVADPAPTATPAGKLLIAALGGWALFRLATRSTTPLPTVIDYAATIAVALAIPALVADPHFYTANSAPVAIAGTAVISFTVSLPARLTLPMTVGIAAAFAYGCAAAVGWQHVPEIFNLYYFALQWITSAAIRAMVLRVATAVDDARTDREAAELSERVTAAVREYDREQLRLLHDTVASTLLIVGGGTPVPPDRLAAQARRDLDMLDNRPTPASARTDLVQAIRDAAAHARTPVHYTGLAHVVHSGRVVDPVAAATREALNNVDQHAAASTVTIDIRAHSLTIRDDGHGYSPEVTPGHGITESIIERMRHIGGNAIIDSAPGRGTTITLTWAPTHFDQDTAVSDPDRLIERSRIGYGIALVLYAVANLAASVWAPFQAFEPAGNRALQIDLAIVAAATTLAAIPAILNRCRLPSWLAWLVAAALLTIALIQSAHVPTNELGAQTHWSQSTIGWCLLPWLLNARLPRAAALLTAMWTVPAVYTILADLSARTVLNIGLGTASILGVQLFALLFNALIKDAAEDAQHETDSRIQLLARQRITAALDMEYRRRYANLADNIRPVLVTLSQASAVSPALRRRAQTEYQSLRACFDQSKTFNHALLQQLRPPIDAAQARGVDVSVHVDGELPELNAAEAQGLASPLAHALAAAGTSARIALTITSTELEASIVCHGLVPHHTLAIDAATSDDGLQLTTMDDTAWLTARHARKGGTGIHELSG